MTFSSLPTFVKAAIQRSSCSMVWPAENIPLGYIFAIGLMIFCSALTIWYFKYKKWL